MNDKVFPWYQPIIEIASGKVAGYEALARRHGDGGEIESAADIFHHPDISAELRLEADRTMRYRALERFSSLDGGTFLSLNLSPEWIDSLESLDQLPTLGMIQDLGIDPGRVVLEITERSGDIERIRELAERYRAAGIRLAYDDFGAGFQQLDRLLAFTPDLIKLDLRTYHNSARAPQNEALLQMLGQLGAQLGSKIVCEGVESRDDFHLALRCNASYVQGYLFEPAVANFSEPDTHRARVRELLAQHLDMRIEETARHQWHAEGLHSNLLALRDLLLTGDSAEALRNYYPARDMLRFYICNRQGDQISPNYRFVDNAWQADSSVIGNNWSWRPYFYQLIGSDDYQRRILRSAPYLDLTTGQPCVTLSLALDAERIMLVDVREKASLGPALGGRSELMPVSS